MRNRVILLVEDNRNDADLTVRALGRSGVSNDVVVVEDGADAIEYLEGTGKYAISALPPEIVLLDLNLPKVGGLDVLRHLRSDERTRLLPVVILTSSTEEADVIASYNLGANSFIRKPVDLAQFTDAARELGLYWLQLNHGPNA